MCVAVAAKIYLKNSNIDKWFLYKIRDKAYVPNFQVHYKNFKGVSTVFVTDDDNDWTEGVNSEGLMIVNTTLQNHDDMTDIVHINSTPSPKTLNYGKILRKAFAQSSVDAAVKIVVDNLLDGNTMISDGETLKVVEIFLKRDVDTRVMAELAKELGLDLKKDRREIRRKMWDRVSKEDYDIEVVEIKDDDFIVRTNHGEFIKDAGFIAADGDGYKSSVKRRTYAEKVIKKMLPLTHPFQVLTVLKNLGNDEIDKEPQNRPLRIPPKGYNFDTDEPVYFTSSIVMLTPTGQLYMLPIDCTFDDYKTSRMTKERNVYFILLPKNLPLFESWGMYDETTSRVKPKMNIMNEIKLVDKYLKKETTVTGDIALPPDKASTKTNAAKMKVTKKGGKKKKVVLHGDTSPAKT